MDLEQVNDPRLIQLTLSGNKEAFGELYERYYSMAYKIALRTVANTETASDLTQEGFLQAYLSLDELRDHSKLRSWLFGIVLNVCRNYLRRKERAVFSFDPAESNKSSLSHGSDQIEEAINQRIADAIDNLSAKLKQSVTMFYFEHLGIREIGSFMGVTQSAIKVRLHRPRSVLRKKLYPVYGRYFDERGKALVQVSILDVILDEESGSCYVLLMDMKNLRCFTMAVGAFEGRSISLGARKIEFPRPPTYKLMMNLVETLGAKIDSVCIEALKGTTFYGLIKLRKDSDFVEVDSRPSDAIALALCTGAPIYISEEVMNNVGVDIPLRLSI